MNFLLRRTALLLPMIAPLISCKRVARCASCGMVVDPSSRWYSEVELQGKTQGFDTPKCAIKYLLSKAPNGVLFVRSYYRQERVPGRTVLFVTGSDVLGPMGEDLIPVEADLEPKFRVEHKSKQSYRFEQLTLSFVESI